MTKYTLPIGLTILNRNYFVPESNLLPWIYRSLISRNKKKDLFSAQTPFSQVKFLKKVYPFIFGSSLYKHWWLLFILHFKIFTFYPNWEIHFFVFYHPATFAEIHNFLLLVVFTHIRLHTHTYTTLCTRTPIQIHAPKFIHTYKLRVYAGILRSTRTCMKTLVGLWFLSKKMEAVTWILILGKTVFILQRANFIRKSYGEIVLQTEFFNFCIETSQAKDKLRIQTL